MSLTDVILPLNLSDGRQDSPASMNAIIPSTWIGRSIKDLEPNEPNAAVDFGSAFFTGDELQHYESCGRAYIYRHQNTHIEPHLGAGPNKTERDAVANCRHASQIRTIDTIGVSFTTSRVNRTTWVIQEDDLYEEHPLIYIKLLPKVSAILVCDTGTDAPTKKNKTHLGASTHLRQYLEHVPIKSNDSKPLNPDGKLTYLIIETHCHYDHTGGMVQFLRGGTTEILASAAGRDFVISDFARNSLWPVVGTAPHYKVTKWAQAFERLTWPFSPKTTAGTSTGGHALEATTDLNITVIHTPGHTPDELAWYDHEEMHLYVGDSFYREGDEGMPIIFPPQGNLIEWVFSMQKLAVFVRGENAHAFADAEVASGTAEAGWVYVAPRVTVSCAHTTTAVDGAEILAELEDFSFKVFAGRVPVVESKQKFGETFDLWKEAGEKRTPISISAPRRLMENARKFFGHDVRH